MSERMHNNVAKLYRVSWIASPGGGPMLERAPVSVGRSNTMKPIAKRGVLAGVLLSLVLALAACASRGAGAQPAVPPADSPFAKIHRGMNEADVRSLLSEPSSSRAYQIAKAWWPFYHGQDTARTDWVYAGQGRVVFSRNRYSGRLSVIDIIYDPTPGG
jgi:hypothetical protein